MLADSLRKSILQAAIEGKLTEQRPDSDGDARDLLAEIQKEKTRLVKEGKIRRSAPLPPVGDDEIPFDIPENWCWVRLGELGTAINGDRGKNYPGKKYWIAQGEPFVNAGSLNNGVLTEDNMNYIDKERYDLLRSGFIEKGDFLYCLRGSLGKFSWNTQFSKGAIGSSLCILRLYFSPINRYFFHYLSSELAQLMVRLSNNGTAQPNLSAEKILRYLVPLPPLAEQRRIVARLEELLPLIDSLSKDEKELDAIEREFPGAIRKSLLQAAIEGKLTEQRPDSDGDARDLLAEIQKEKARLVKEGKIRRTTPLPPVGDDEKPFDIPENWCWVRLGECISLLSGQDLTPTGYNNQGNGIPYITGASNFQNGEIIINRWTTQPKAISHQDDILLTCKGTVGEVAFLKVNEAHIARQIMAITPILLNACYLANSLNFYVGELKRKAKSIIPGIERKNVLNMPFPLPPLAEQRRIVARLEKLLPLVDELGKMEKELSDL